MQGSHARAAPHKAKDGGAMRSKRAQSPARTVKHDVAHGRWIRVAPSRTSVCSMKTAGRSRSGRSPPLPTIPPAAERELVAWAVNTAHHADFADRGHAHIYQEGLRIPPVRLYRAGVLQTDVQELKSRGGRVRSPPPGRHTATAALSGPPHLLCDDLWCVRIARSARRGSRTGANSCPRAHEPQRDRRSMRCRYRERPSPRIDKSRFSDVPATD